MAEVNFPTIMLILYASFYIISVFAIGMWVYYSRKKKIANIKANMGGNTEDEEVQQRATILHQRAEGVKKDMDFVPNNYFEAVWYAREIYTAVIVHTYDQATDIAVLIDWIRLTRYELNGGNIANVNMLSFLIPGAAFIILYRVITMVFAIYDDTRYQRAKRKMKAEKKVYAGSQANLLDIPQKGCLDISWDIFLCAFDLYFFKVIYHEFVTGDYRPNSIHRSIQLCEALFESMPQVVLQSVFLLKYTAEEEQNFASIGLLVLSIIASILSIANKYAWFDQQAVVVDAKEMHGGRRGEGYCSWRFLVRFIWRWSDLCTNFAIFALLWVIVGGLWVAVYVVICYVVYYFVVVDRIKMTEENRWYRLLATTICIVGVILDWEWHFCILRLIDNGVMMLLIIILASVDLTCNDGDIWCSSNALGNAWDTSLIRIFLIMGITSYIVELITYPIIQSTKFGIIKKALQGRQFFSIMLFGDESTQIPGYYLTYYIDSGEHENNNGLSYIDIIYFTGKRSKDDCEKLGERLEDIFKNDKSLNLSSGDIAVDYTSCKVFKYGISIKCLQNVYTNDNQQRFGDEAMRFVKDIYEDEKNMEEVRKLFDKHFDKRDKSKQWKLKFSADEATFLVLNIDDPGEEKEGDRQAVVRKFRFAQEVKKINREIRIIVGYDMSVINDRNKITKDSQVVITVIDRNGYFRGSNEAKYSTKNEDLFARQRMALKILNQSKQEGILPYIGWDDADDAYFIVTQRLFGDKILEHLGRGGAITEAKLIFYIRKMLELIQHCHRNHVVMRNLSPDSFQFYDKGSDPVLYLTHYEDCRAILVNDEKYYGNVKGKVIYMSPEMCKVVVRRRKNKLWAKDISGKMYMATDVWAMGVMAFYLISGQHPFFDGRVKANQLRRTLKGIINHKGFDFKKMKFEPFKVEEANELFEDWLNKVLCPDYTKRATIEEALSHKFFSLDLAHKLENDTLRPRILDVMKNGRARSKLHKAIVQVRIAQVIQDYKKDVMKSMRDINEVGDAEIIQKTDTQIDREYNAEEDEEIAMQFKRIDLDGDGYTDVKELTKLLLSLGYAKNFAVKEATKIFEEMDENGDGVIDFEEFAQAWIARKLTIDDKYAHAIFDVFDHNSDGFIDKDELRGVLYPDEDEKDVERLKIMEEIANDPSFNDEDDFLGDFMDALIVDQKTEELQQIIDEVDDDDDQKISFDEFHKAMIADAHAHDELEEEAKHKIDAMPFASIYNDLEFREMNKDGNDPMFEDEQDYIKLDDEPPNNELCAISINIANEMQEQKEGNGDDGGNAGLATPGAGDMIVNVGLVKKDAMTTPIANSDVGGETPVGIEPANSQSDE